MKLGIMQPYLFPYLGYFQLMEAVDTFVIYDDVQYIKHGWINRNNLLGFGKTPETTVLPFTFSVKRDSMELNINQRYYSESFKAEADTFLKTLQRRYSKAPYYDEVSHLIKDILSYSSRNVAEFNANSMKCIAEYCGIETEFMFSSELDIPDDLKAQKRILHICKELKTDEYINPIGGIEL